MLSNLQKSDLFKEYQIDLNRIFYGEEALTFLVGAGISMESPSNLISARQMMQALVRFGTPKEVLDKIMAIKGLKYEFLFEAFRDRYDHKLKIMEYFEEFKQPNSIHNFLAQSIQRGHCVITTNFDYLIERAIGLTNPNLRVIITKDDFLKYSDPVKTHEMGFLAVYKIHGCLRNPVSGEDTRESIITTLDSLGKNKSEGVFSIEPYKYAFLQAATRNRTLVILGYSGGDDFDIIPTLLEMRELKRIIWISHSIDQNSSAQIYQFNSKVLLNPTALKELNKEDQILYQLALLGNIEIVKVITHTGSLFALQKKGKISFKSRKIVNPYSWIKKNIRVPIKGEREFFAGRIFCDYACYDQALSYLQKAYNISNQKRNTEIMARALSNLGFVYLSLGHLSQALTHYEQAYQFHEQLLDSDASIRDLSNIGLVHLNNKDFQQAITIFQKVYHLAEQNKNIGGMARSFGNLGIVYISNKELNIALDQFQNAQKLFEQIGDLKGQATVLGNIGLIYQKLKNNNKALEYFQQAYRIHDRLGYMEGLATNLGNIGNTYVEFKNLSEALKYHQKAHEIDAHLGNLKQIAIDIANIGLDYRLMNNETEAQKYVSLLSNILENLDPTIRKELLEKHETIAKVLDFKAIMKLV